MPKFVFHEHLVASRQECFRDFAEYHPDIAEIVKNRCHAGVQKVTVLSIVFRKSGIYLLFLEDDAVFHLLHLKRSGENTCEVIRHEYVYHAYPRISAEEWEKAVILAKNMFFVFARMIV